MQASCSFPTARRLAVGALLLTSAAVGVRQVMRDKGTTYGEPDGEELFLVNANAFPLAGVMPSLRRIFTRPGEV